VKQKASYDAKKITYDALVAKDEAGTISSAE
jgi:hypothetical protein